MDNFIAANKTWQWTMWVHLMFFGALLPFVLMLPESFAPVLLEARDRKRTGKGKPTSAEKRDTLKLLYKKLQTALSRPFIMLCTDPVVAPLLIYLAFVFALLFAFFEAFPIIFLGVYRMEPGVEGLTFLGVGLGVLVGLVVYGVHDRLAAKRRQTEASKAGTPNRAPKPPLPEDWMMGSKIGGVALPVSLFWLGWTARKSVHWMVPLAAGVPFGFSLMLIFLSVISYLGMSIGPDAIASAVAANNFLRYLLASVFPLFVVQMYRRLGIPWASSTFGFISLALMPIPWVFQRYGARLRMRSAFCLHADPGEGPGLLDESINP